MQYIFGDYVLDTQRQELQQAGAPVPLRRKVFQVLVYLLAHHERVVPKQELLEHLWPDQFVGDEALLSCIRALRRAFGERGRSPRMLRTLHGQGYRFVAPVETREHRTLDVPAPPPLLAGHARMQAEGPLDAPPIISALSAPLAGPEAAQRRPTPASATGERKVVTMLCCGLGETPALGGADDLDTLHSLLRTVHAVVQEEVDQYGGTVQHVTGEHLLAVFGAPVAYEDHAQRAVLAALAIQQRVRETALAAGALPVRLGLHTGLVAVGGLGDAAGAALAMIGDVARLATLLQAQAAPGVILCSAATARLVQETVCLEVAQPMPDDGQTRPGVAYQILGPRPQQRLVVGRGARELSRFVGRARELAVLQAVLAQVTAGRGQVVGIVGEPGIGKSRLFHEFRQHLRGTPVTYVTGQCLSYGQATPYLPVLDILHALCGLTETDDGATLVAKVQRAVQAAGVAAAEWAPYLLELLGMDTATTALAQQAPEARKARTFAVLRQVLLHHSRQQPLVIAIDNLHWSDPTSEEFLTSLVDHLAGVRLLVLGTYRPGYRPPWLEKSYATQLALPPLDTPDSRTVLQGILRAHPVSDAILDTLLRTAEGNPFFLEELAWTVVEQSAAATLTVPDTIQAVLMARIDRLPPAAKQLLQRAAVIGKEVPRALLGAVADLPEATLQASLAHLRAAEFLYATRPGPDEVYTFKHALTQETAYQSLLKTTRQQVHFQIAQVLEERFLPTVETQPELLARHYTEAGLIAPAIPCWQRAARQARQRAAFVEAITHLTKGLALLETLPDTPERARQELDLQIALGSALSVTKGPTAPDVERVYARAHALCQTVGDTPQRFRVLQGLHVLSNNRGEFQRSRELAEQLLSLAQRLQDPALRLAAHRALGEVWFQLGEFTAALAHCEQGMALAQQYGALALGYGGGLGVDCLRFAARVLWQMGYPDQALQRSHEALTLARTFAHPHSVAAALCQMAHVHHLRREAPQSQERAEAAITVAQEQGFWYWLTWGTFTQGWARATQGVPEPGITQMCQSVAAKQVAGHKEALPFALAQLAEVYLGLGQAEESQRLLAEALALTRHTGECWGEAEVYRLQGEFLLQQAVADPTQAEACLQQALAIARRQQAKSWELRAAMSLARLWQQQGKRREASALLAPLYGWFTEGFETADLQEAGALLAELEG
jgi:predicted ATPase/DNA-binding winged helix-turn-helix (wHTH) protein/class 3 adenylate cyclase